MRSRALSQYLRPAFAGGLDSRNTSGPVASQRVEKQVCSVTSMDKLDYGKSTITKHMHSGGRNACWETFPRDASGSFCPRYGSSLDGWQHVTTGYMHMTDRRLLFQHFLACNTELMSRCSDVNRCYQCVGQKSLSPIVSAKNFCRKQFSQSCHFIVCAQSELIPELCFQYLWQKPVLAISPRQRQANLPRELPCPMHAAASCRSLSW